MIDLPSPISRNQRRHQGEERYERGEGLGTHWKTCSYWRTSEYGHGDCPSWCPPLRGERRGRRAVPPVANQTNVIVNSRAFLEISELQDVKTKMTYLEKHYALRVQRRNGTSKLLLGLTGNPPKIGSLKQIKVGGNEVVTAKIVNQPFGDHPAEAIEV
jgi:hypothetical protein